MKSNSPKFASNKPSVKDKNPKNFLFSFRTYGSKKFSKLAFFFGGCFAFTVLCQLTSSQSMAAGLQEGPLGTIRHTKSQITATGKISDHGVLPAPLKSKLPQGRGLKGIDNGYSRIYFPYHEIEKPSAAPPQIVHKYTLPQRVAGQFNSPIAYTPIVLTPNNPFDQYGRRFIQARTHFGVKILLQGIVELTPEYALVKGIQLTGRKEFEAPFSEYISTSSIKSQTLIDILRNATVDLNSKEERLKIILFLVAAKRYVDARTELRNMAYDFPDWAKTDQFKDFQETIANDIGRISFRELQRLKDAGQRKRVLRMLKNFDSSEVSSSVMINFNSFRKELTAENDKIAKIKKMLTQDFDIVANDKSIHKLLRKQIAAEKDKILPAINYNNYLRLSPYILRTEDKQTTFKERIAFAISGWYLGANNVDKNLNNTLAVATVKDLVVKYLQSPDPQEREDILYKIKASEGGSVKNIAAIAKHIKPWKSNKDTIKDNRGFERLKLTNFPNSPEVLVSLPPEYDPYRKYPCILAICDSYGSPEKQLGWWKTQADRNGYIVIAPDWRERHKKQYDYSVHAAQVVLSGLRECKRRYSIDSDKVFISGHLRGAEVAMDLGLAHPDLWSGIINISMIADKYLPFYKQNIKYRVPVYSVLGELHNAPARGISRSSDKRNGLFGTWINSGHFNFVLVVYKGRQAEYFYEEIHRIFDWCSRQRRKFALQDDKFEVKTMRRWDNFFWWAELHDIPNEFHLSPFRWNFVKKRKSLGIEGSCKKANNGEKTIMKIAQGGKNATFWISPAWVDMSKRIHFKFKTQEKTDRVLPEQRVILEDLRTRCDVNFPFWASYSYINKKWIPNATSLQLQSAQK